MWNFIKAVFYIPILIVAPNADNWSKSKANCSAVKACFQPKPKVDEKQS